ncbi:MAG: T9SS type A sorting domain-containing protein, partial [Bacteroidetes bacterium]|nr:T9SS type A sorting domain-containing protein [Bacteroidota bacterium]
VGATHFPINLIAEEQSNDFNMPYTCKKNQYSTYVTCKYTKGIKYYQDSCALKFVNTHSGYVLFGDNCEFYGYTGNVKALSFLNQVELFPNPSSSDHMTLRFKAIYYKPIEISIYNTLGQKIYHEKVNIEATENEIKLMNLNLKQGLYTLQINSEEETSSINFIKY